MPSDPPSDLPEELRTEAHAGTTAEVAVALDPAPEALSPAKEWGAAVVLMVVFALITAAFVSVFHG